MRYDEYLARGLPIGWGGVEAGKQDRRRTAPEVHRHALDGGRREPGAVGALRAAQRLVRRLLGRTPAPGRMIGLPEICPAPIASPIARFRASVSLAFRVRLARGWRGVMCAPPLRSFRCGCCKRSPAVSHVEAQGAINDGGPMTLPTRPPTRTHATIDPRL